MPPRIARRVCFCKCHRCMQRENEAPFEHAALDYLADPPDVRDGIATITACTKCQPDHCVAFLYDPEAPPERERVPWVDPPRKEWKD